MKKQTQLGMNPGTASHRLVKDLLFRLLTDAGHTCFKCGGKMSRNDFSIEHKKPWLDSIDPVRLFFDLENVAFSHLRCNVSERRTSVIAQCGTHSKYAKGCRCEECKRAHSAEARKTYTPEGRNARYQRSGK